MGGERPDKALVESIRKQCLAKGIQGIKGLSVIFRGMDRDYSKNLCFIEFYNGLKLYGIKLEESDIRQVFKRFDMDNSDAIDFREFLLELRPPMKACRIELINEAFDKLDVNKDGFLQTDDLKETYKHFAERHPRYVSGELTIDEVLTLFLSTFDDPNDKDGIVTREEFMNYYAGVSCTIEDDLYFDLMMRSAWGLPQRGCKK